MTDARQVVLAYLGVATVTAFVVNSLPGLVMVAAALVALLAGYRRRLTKSAAAAGVIMYYPLAVAAGEIVPGGWGFVCSALILIPLSERLSFEYYLSTSMGTPGGVDEETRNLADSLSRSHGIKLLWYTALASGVSLLSFGASQYTLYSPFVVTAAFLLVFALWAYVRR